MRTIQYYFDNLKSLWTADGLGYAYPPGSFAVSKRFEFEYYLKDKFGIGVFLELSKLITREEFIEIKKRFDDIWYEAFPDCVRWDDGLNDLAL